MIQPVNALAPKVSFKGQYSDFKNPVNRRTEKRLAILNAGGISVAMGMLNYLNERGGKIDLRAIEKPEIEGTCPLTMFEQVLRHEEYVTSRINHVMDVAEEVKDRAAMHLLDWYIKEQVEEEANVGGVLASLRLISDDKKSFTNLG